MSGPVEWYILLDGLMKDWLSLISPKLQAKISVFLFNALEFQTHVFVLEHHKLLGKQEVCEELKTQQEAEVSEDELLPVPGALEPVEDVCASCVVDLVKGVSIRFLHGHGVAEGGQGKRWEAVKSSSSLYLLLVEVQYETYLHQES